MTGNWTYFAFIKLLRSKLMCKDTKMKLYKALIRPVVTYGAQAWTLRTVDDRPSGCLKGKFCVAYMVLSVYKESGG
jgi:hypothetical protein